MKKYGELAHIDMFQASPEKSHQAYILLKYLYDSFL